MQESIIKKFLYSSFIFITFGFLFSNSCLADLQQTKSVKLGIFPYVSPGQLVKFHTDLKNLFEQTLGKKVTLVTAPNFKKFVGRTRKSEYDFIMTAPHLGRLAEVRDGYIPLAHTMHEVQGIYLVSKTSNIHSLKDLKGKTITMVGRTAIITQMVEKQLAALGLHDKKNITLRFTKTHNNAMYSPLRGESDASVTGTLLWNKIGLKNIKSTSQIRVIGKSPLSIGFQVMAAKQVTTPDLNKIKTALLGFHKTTQGKIYMKKTGFKYFDEISNQEKMNLDPYIQVFLRKK